MPITTEKHTRKAKRGVALAIAGGVLLVLLSLPLVLTLFRNGLRLGQHGVLAGFGIHGVPMGDPIPGFWTRHVRRDPTGTRHYIGWGLNSYYLYCW